MKIKLKKEKKNTTKHKYSIHEHFNSLPLWLNHNKPEGALAPDLIAKLVN